MKVFRRTPAIDPAARERALARLGARPPEHAHPEEGDEHVRGGWIPDPVQPERLKDARWTLTPKHIAVLALILTIGLIWAAWSVFHTRPETLPDTRPTTTTGSPVTQPTQTATQPTNARGSPTPTVLVVDVAGKVRRPGLVRAPTGARVADVLTLAGGPLPGVDLTPLNLARQVTDGEQIIVGQPNQPPPATPPANHNPTAPPTAPTDSINLNTATLAQLDTLPGVGPVLAQRILDYRTENGPFTTLDQLQEVPGVGPKKFDSLKPHVHL